MSTKSKLTKELKPKLVAEGLLDDTQKTTSIDGGDKLITASAVKSVKVQLENDMADFVKKTEFSQQVMKSLSVDFTTESPIITYDKITLPNGTTVSTSVELPLASANSHGLMPHESVRAIDNLNFRLGVLEDGYSEYITQTNLTSSATQTQIQNEFVTVSGLQTAMNSTRLVSMPSGLYWRWNSVSGVWNGPFSQTLLQFTNQSYGSIKGSDEDGKVFAEADGTGSVKGWSNFKIEFDNHTKDTLSHVSAADRAKWNSGPDVTTLVKLVSPTEQNIQSDLKLSGKFSTTEPAKFESDMSVDGDISLNGGLRFGNNNFVDGWDFELPYGRFNGDITVDGEVAIYYGIAAYNRDEIFMRNRIDMDDNNIYMRSGKITNGFESTPNTTYLQFSDNGHATLEVDNRFTVNGKSDYSSMYVKTGRIDLIGHKGGQIAGESSHLALTDIVDIQAKKEIRLQSNENYISAYAETAVNVGTFNGPINIQASRGDFVSTLKLDSDVKLWAEKNIELNADWDLTLRAEGTVNVTSGGSDVNVYPEARFKVQAGQGVFLNGGEGGVSILSGDIDAAINIEAGVNAPVNIKGSQLTFNGQEITGGGAAPGTVIFRGAWSDKEFYKANDLVYINAINVDYARRFYICWKDTTAVGSSQKPGNLYTNQNWTDISDKAYTTETITMNRVNENYTVNSNNSYIVFSVGSDNNPGNSGASKMQLMTRAWLKIDAQRRLCDQRGLLAAESTLKDKYAWHKLGHTDSRINVEANDEIDLQAVWKGKALDSYGTYLDDKRGIMVIDAYDYTTGSLSFYTEDWLGEDRYDRIIHSQCENIELNPVIIITEDFNEFVNVKVVDGNTKEIVHEFIYYGVEEDPYLCVSCDKRLTIMYQAQETLLPGGLYDI